MVVLVLGAACVISAIVSVAAASPIPVSQCGQTINGTADLTVDLDCTGISPSLTIRRGTLRLNGFSVTGDTIECETSCKVIGPGSLHVDVTATKSTAKRLIVQDLTSTGIVSSFWGRVRVDGCTITNGRVRADTAVRVVDSVLSGTCVSVSSEKGGAKVKNTTIQDCPGTAVLTTKAVVIDSVLVRNTGSGIVARDSISPFFRIVGKARVSGSTIAENGGSGVSAGILVSVRNSTIKDNVAYGVRAFRSWHSDTDPNAVGGVKVSRSTISGNQTGIFGNKVSVLDSLVTNNAVRGVEANALTVRGVSDLRGNAMSADCGTTDVCLDVATSTKPFGVNPSNCDTSRQLEFLPGSSLGTDSWSVCFLD